MKVARPRVVGHGPAQEIGDLAPCSTKEVHLRHHEMPLTSRSRSWTVLDSTANVASTLYRRV
ncbi:hypothetical protein FOCC_FOCC014231 [Frankliniella occidentalis]|nr:hypothetical protein FOCC_FOCC014231 [Frankliniella occidentalis]